MSTLKIGFLGAGKMATALAKGFIDAGLVEPGDIVASDVAAGAREAFASETGARTTEDNEEVVKASTTVLLAVKPGQVAEVLEEVCDSLRENTLILSIAAGVRLSAMEKLLPKNARVVRVMPNTPALIGHSASAYAMGGNAKQEDARLAARLLQAVGLAVEVKEPLLDAVTGLSGSGPAYVYLMIEALSDGGVAAGLPRDLATRLAAQTLMGAARMVLETGKHPGELKDMVTSPGGTTIAGVHELEKAGFRGAVMNAVKAAAARSAELS